MDLSDLVSLEVGLTSVSSMWPMTGLQTSLSDSRVFTRVLHVVLFLKNYLYWGDIG